MTRKRCLVVGGRAVRRRALATLLAQEGSETREVASASDALRLLTDFVPDAVLCDADVGAALVDVLRAARSRNPAVRIVVARDGSATASGAESLVDVFFDRPVNLFELRRALGIS